MDKDKTTMKVCMNVECAGKEQPHSHDDSVGGMDCDGPCSQRRVDAWHANLTADKTRPTPSISGPYDMCGRDVLLVPLIPDERHEPSVPECFDCGANALTIVVERPNQAKTHGSDAWPWCGICQIG